MPFITVSSLLSLCMYFLKMFTLFIKLITLYRNIIGKELQQDYVTLKASGEIPS